MMPAFNSGYQPALHHDSIFRINIQDADGNNLRVFYTRPGVLASLGVERNAWIESIDDLSLTVSDKPMGIHWTGIVFGLGFVTSFGYWTTDFLVVQRVLAAKDMRSAETAPIIGAAFKMLVPFIVILRACLRWGYCP